MDSLEVFTAKNNPLGGEIDITWEYPKELPPLYKAYIFKKSVASDTEPNPDDVLPNSIVYNYIKEPTRENLPSGVFVFNKIQPDKREIVDYKTTETVWYVYKGILVDLTDNELHSEIVSTVVQAKGFTTDLFVVDTKQLVLDGISKLMSAVGKVFGGSCNVYRDYSQVETKPNQNVWIVVLLLIVSRELNFLMCSYHRTGTNT